MISEEHDRLVRDEAYWTVRNLPAFIDRDDTQQDGYIGYLSAMKTWDPSRSTTSYLRLLVRGEILDSIRRSNPYSRPSATRRRKLIRETRKQLEQRLGRAADQQELADAMGVTMEKYSSMLVQNEQRTLPVEDAPLRTPASQLDSVEATERASSIRAIVDALPGREAQVIVDHFYKDLTRREIADQVGLSENRIGQILSQAIERLRKRLLAQSIA